MRKYGLALFGALMLFGIASAQKAPPADPLKPDDRTYTIKLQGASDRGSSSVSTKSLKVVGTIKITTAAGKLVNDTKINETSEEVYTETVLEKGARKAKKLKRVYTKATKNGEPASYQGQTILFEEKAGKYTASVEGDGTVPPKDLNDLVKNLDLNHEYDTGKAILPGKPVKVGESWTPDKAVILKGLAASLGGEANASKSTAEVKLLRAYKKGDKQFGVIELNCKVALAKLGNITFDTPATFAVNLKFDMALDGSSSAGTMSGLSQLKGKGEMEQDGEKLIVEFSQDLSAKTESSEKK